MGQVQHSEQIDASPEQIWTIISDVTRLPDWAHKDGRFPYPVEGKYGDSQTEGVGTLWIGVTADGQTAVQKITAWEPPNKLTYELLKIENAPLQMSQASTFTLETVEAGTRVTWHVDWELTGGFSLNSLLVRFTGNSAFEEMMAGSLENLKQLVETERPDPAGVGPARLPAECPRCEEPIFINQVDWRNPKKAACAFCGEPLVQSA